MRKFAFLATVFSIFFIVNVASAQQFDPYFGFGTIVSPGADQCGEYTTGFLCPEKGGLYPNVGADVIFHRRIGFAFDASWRGSQGNFANIEGFPYRPILFDFNGVYQPRISKKVGADLFGGIGWQSTRFYGFSPTFSCEQLGACYTSNNHFLVDVGGGLRYYVWGHFFVRPEAHYYHIMNNNDNFTSGNVLRVGASIGYTIGPE